MKKLFISILIGTIAGLIDIIPMIVQGLNRYANSSAFFHWVALGIIISYISMDIRGWLKGLIIAEISSIPIAIIVAQNDPVSVIPIIIMSAILGSLVGFFSGRFAR